MITIPLDRPPYPGKQEELQHPSTTWALPEFAQTPLTKLVAEYRTHILARTNRPGCRTVDTYSDSINNLVRNLSQHGDPLVLASLTKYAVERWVGEQRGQGRSEEGIATRLNQVKVFTHKFVYKELELTTRDLLEKVSRITVDPKVVPALSESEINVILDELDRPTFEDTRDRAFVAVCASTGLRFAEVLRMTASGIDKISGEFVTVLKGGEEHLARVSPRALKLVKAYLRARPESSPDALWLSIRGTPLTYIGGQKIFTRLRGRVHLETKVHAHLFRHTFAQTALQKGAGAAEVQDMLGHRSPEMTRRYTGTVRKHRAAANMPRYSPI